MGLIVSAFIGGGVSVHNPAVVAIDLMHRSPVIGFGHNFPNAYQKGLAGPSHFALWLVPIL